MNKQNKILSLNDLYDFYTNKYKRSVKFNSEKEGYNLAVQVNGTASFNKDDYDPTLGLQKIHLRSCHLYDNRNKSYISDEAMNQAISSFQNRPILGFVHKLKNGDYEFAGHEFKIDDDGNFEYEEVPVGVVPETNNAQLVYDQDMDKTYLEVDGLIYEGYSHAAEIIERKGECKVSVELSIDEMSYSAKEHMLSLDKFHFSGITILGVTRDGSETEIQEGMLGSKLTLKDFSESNNSLFSSITEETRDTKLIETLEKLNTTLSNLNINQADKSAKENSKEGGNETGMTKYEKLKTKYNKTDEDITFDIDGLSDSELEEKFKEVFGETETETESKENPEKEEQEQEEETETEQGEEESEEEESIENNACKKKKKCELDNGNMEISFELSHEDTRYALYNLISQYDELDNEWYYIENVYDTYFVMSSWDTGTVYGQKYIKDGDNVSLDGERYKLFKELLTETEKTKLDKMRSDYSSMEEKLATYEKAELNAKKDEVFAEPSYEEFLETDEFKTLISDKDKYSVDELKDKCEIAFAKLIRAKGSFSYDPNKQNNKQSKVNFSYEAENKDEYDPYPEL